MQQNIREQLEEKNRKKADIQKEKNSPKTGIVFTCEHGTGLYPCSICSKLFPRKLLSQNIFGKLKGK